jgi:hypothetical protein
MTNPLVEYERQAFNARDQGDFRTAIMLYEKIAKENPNWEHGQVYYDLAGCYEDIGDLQKAEENYLRALEIQPNYYIFVGGYAGFLDRHGDPRAAFDFFAKLFRDGDAPGLDSIKSKLYILGEQIGWTEDEVETLLEKSKYSPNPLSAKSLMNIEIDRTFSGDYDCQLLHEIPSGTAISHYLPEQQTGQDGILLRISPRGVPSWIGLFSSVKKYPGTPSRILFTPNPNTICVICSGDAVITDVTRPDRSTLLDFEPITDAVAVKERKMIVFAGFTKLMAFDGSNVVMWETSRVAWDELKITSISPSSIFGEYWDVATEKKAQFEVDLDTGEVNGAIDQPF